METAIVIYYDEIALKGRNRRFFEDKLADNIREHLCRFGNFKTRLERGRIIVKPDLPFSDAQCLAVKEALLRVSGIGYFYLAARTGRTFENIAETAVGLTSGRKEGTFKVETRRSDKTFPMDSMEVSRKIGGRVLEARPDMRVDVHDPEMTIEIRIDDEGAYATAERTEGIGGLPTGVSGTLVVLLSGGIDSPVAAWKTMRRGCRIVFAHFHSMPYVGRESVDKVERLAEILAGYQLRVKSYYVPFGDVQREIVAKADPRMRVILYRRMMLRIAEEIARREGALGLVTGDSIGQVASQTLENLATVSAAVDLPIYRPLIGDDKRDIIDEARAIGTYAVSIEPHDDCCSLFVPPNPATTSTPERAEAEEMKYDVKALAAAALERAEIQELSLRGSGVRSNPVGIVSAVPASQ